MHKHIKGNLLTPKRKLVKFSWVGVFCFHCIWCAVNLGLFVNLVLFNDMTDLPKKSQRKTIIQAMKQRVKTPKQREFVCYFIEWAKFKNLFPIKFKYKMYFLFILLFLHKIYNIRDDEEEKQKNSKISSSIEQSNPYPTSTPKRTKNNPAH